MNQLFLECVWLVVLISAVPVGCVSFACGVVAALQSATQIQEQSVIHLVRIGVFAGTAYLLGGAGVTLLRQLFVKTLVAIELVGKV
jgi:type III secretory pathway component EscS